MNYRREMAVSSFVTRLDEGWSTRAGHIVYKVSDHHDGRDTRGSLIFFDARKVRFAVPLQRIKLRKMEKEIH